MTARIRIPRHGTFVAAIFHDTDAFERALAALIARGIDRSAVSILANHEVVEDHFGGIPTVEDMADRADTPREDLDTQGALKAAIDFISETFAVVGQIGAAAVAYAVGGPVGIAATSSSLVDASVSDLMSDYVDQRYHERFDRSVRDGGLICWVHVYDAGKAREVTRILAAEGGEHVHMVDLMTPPRPAPSGP